MHPIQLFALLAPLQDGTAPAGGAQPQGLFESLTQGMLFPLLLCGVVFYFIVLRPEQRARKSRAAMLDAMKKGDRVLTRGGVYGTIAQVQDQVVTLQVDEGVRLRFARAAIESIVSSDDKPGEKPTDRLDEQVADKAKAGKKG